MSCCICLEELSSPVSLPCGHVFCQECLKRAVQSVQPYSTLHACPTCRTHYFITPLDMSTVPPHLRPHLTPSIRKVYLDLPPRSDKPEASASNTAASGVPYDLSIELARLHAEKEALRLNCSMWKKRAEVHSSATLGMLELSRVARDQVVQVSRDRDTLQRNYLKLKQDFQQQNAILQSLVSMPQQRFGSPSNLLPPQTQVDQSTLQFNVQADLSATSSVPLRRSCPTEERCGKRLWSEDDDDGRATLLHSRPGKVARLVETDSLIASGIRPSAVQVKTETSQHLVSYTSLIPSTDT